MFNIIDLIVILVIMLSVFFGYKKGFIRTVVSLLSFFIAIGMALLFYKPFAVILTENTTIDDWIIENIISKEDLNESIQDIANEENSENIVGSGKEENAEGLETFLEMIEILPNTITNNVDIEEIKNNTREEIAYKISELIMNLLSLIAIYIVVKITLIVAMFVLDGIMKFPVLKQLNEICGMTIGAVLGFTQIYIAFAAITFISSICDISNVISAIKVSAFARILFENNLIINLLF